MQHARVAVGGLAERAAAMQRCRLIEQRINAVSRLHVRSCVDRADTAAT